MALSSARPFPHTPLGGLPVVRLLSNIKFWLLASVFTWITVVTVLISQTP